MHSATRADLLGLRPGPTSGLTVWLTVVKLSTCKRSEGAQGTDYSAPDKVVASVKHFAAYGQPEGGREYHTTDISEQRLRNLYLPPFKAAVDAGADTAMCSFNAISGVPGCANHQTETDILKGEWGFDQVVLALGESRGQSGEAASRSEIDLPGKQQELIDAIKATGKPFVMVLFNGRPLTLTKVDASSPAILEAWFPGVEAGNAVADVLFGKVTASVDVANSGDRKGDDVVQVYIHDPVASISHPVRRLRGFQRVTLAPGESQTVSFTLDKSDFGFYDNRGKLVVEPGSIDVFAGDSSSADLEQSFTVAAEASTPHTSEPQKGPKTGPGPVDLGGRAASTI
jgi:hypothetical protein